MAERLRREAGGEPPVAQPGERHDWTKGLPPRAEFVGQMLRRQAEGGQSGRPRTAEQWGAEWDRMDAKLRAHQGG